MVGLSSFRGNFLIELAKIHCVYNIIDDHSRMIIGKKLSDVRRKGQALILMIISDVHEEPPNMRGPQNT